MTTLWNLSLSAGVLILAVAAVRALLLHRLPRRTFLWLWGVALCRLLLPVAVPSRFSVFTLLDRRLPPPVVGALGGLPLDPEAVWLLSGESEAAAGAVLGGAPALSPVLLLWLAGAAGMLLFFAGTHLRFRWSYRTALPVESGFADRWREQHPLGRGVLIRQSDRITAPLTYGILRPVVLLPKSLLSAGERELGYVLCHEYTHIRRLDVLAKWLLAGALCLHWFNPLVWVMYQLANRDLEISCDAAVVAAFGEPEKSAYALTLIGLEEKRSPLNPLCSGFSKNSIEERIVSIMRVKKITLWGAALAALVVVGTAAVFATTAAARDPAGVPTMASEPVPAASQAMDAGELEDFLPAYSPSVPKAPSVPEIPSVPEVSAPPDMSKMEAELTAKLDALWKDYSKFSLIRDGAQIAYKGQPVRFFADNHSGTPEKFSGMIISNDNMQSGYRLEAIRDADKRLIDIAEITQARQKELYNPGAQPANPEMEADLAEMEADLAEMEADLADMDTALTDARGTPPDPKSLNLEAVRKEYAAFGLTWGGVGSKFLYKDQPVCFFADNYSGTPEKFGGIISGDPAVGGYRLEAIRDADNYLIDIVEITEARQKEINATMKK